MPTSPSRNLETFPNPETTRDYLIRMDLPEFTCVCPLTGQPDFAHMRLEYIPDALCIETKSLKLYLWSWREVGIFHEAVTNTVADDLIAALAPRYLKLAASFNVRGGIYPEIIVEHRVDGWSPSEPVYLP